MPAYPIERCLAPLESSTGFSCGRYSNRQLLLRKQLPRAHKAKALGEQSTSGKTYISAWLQIARVQARIYRQYFIYGEAGGLGYFIQCIPWLYHPEETAGARRYFRWYDRS